MKSFLFRDFEDDRRHSRSYFSLWSQQNLTFKDSLDAEIDLEDKEIRDSKIKMSK